VEASRDEFRVGATGPRLHLLRWGDPKLPLLIALHGGGANAHWWDHLAPAFASRFHVVGLDFRGHGDSDRPDDLVPGAFNDDLEALLAHLGHETSRRTAATIVGHSMGANIGLVHAAQHPLRALVLIDPSRGGDKRHSRRMRLALALRQNYRSREEAVNRFRFLPDAEHATEELRRAIAEHSVGQDPDGRWGYKFDSRWFGLKARSKPAPGRVTCPTLIVRGAESGILSQEGASALLAELPRGELVTIERAGHHVQLDRPQEVTGAIDRFLDQHPDRASGDPQQEVSP